MKIRIEPYKSFSGGARALAIRAGILRATKKQVEKHGSFGIIINWGNSQRRFDNAQYINTPEAVSLASDKIKSYERFTESGTPCPAYTTDQKAARTWLETSASSDGRATKNPEPSSTILCRKLTKGSGGRGIVLATTPEELVNAPLYTKYIKKTDEYRVHVFFGEIIDIQQKRKRLEIDNEEVNYQIRNASNGWVYCRGGVSAPPNVGVAATSAITALGLDFGAVDIGYTIKKDLATVYEVNTAPGLEGSTLDKYYDAISRKYPQLRGGAYRRRRLMAGVQ